MSTDPLEFTGSDSQPQLNTKPLFKLMVERKASDLFFTSNAPIKRCCRRRRCVRCVSA